MTDDKIKLIIGALLHDVGKVVYRNGDDGRNHSVSGEAFLKEVGINDKSILDAVRYHHAKELRNANLDDNSFAYITCVADNVASAADRRKDDETEYGFDKKMPLEPVFNILNKNNGNLIYKAQMLEPDAGINYPTNQNTTFYDTFYKKVTEQISDNLKTIYWKDEYINSILSVLEAALSYVPSSTAKNERPDISLYDHVKLTAAVASCLYDYLEGKGISYKDALFKNENFYDEKAFLLFSMDVSGIQSFIYTVDSKDALKNLRARSFYLEIMMEHIVDELLSRLELSRANLIYSGGGHCYMLLPNTAETIEAIEAFEKEINEWFLKEFDVSLYVASGYAPCSANDLKNEPKDSYKAIFKNVSEMISTRKSRRYTSEQIIALNNVGKKNNQRECRICKRMDNLVDDISRAGEDKYICRSCLAIINFSKEIMNKEKSFYTVVKSNDKNSLKLPFDCCLTACDKNEAGERMKKDDYVRTYSKNGFYTGEHVATKIWVADYASQENSFKELVGASDEEGIERIGILRADVDNLGKAFVSGFENDANGDKYVSISRTATLSRQLSMFFKYHIKSILETPEYVIKGKDKKERKAVVVYSGGDDLFIVGAWDDVLELSFDITEAFEKYTCGTLTLSAGIGLYDEGFPIHVSADEVASLEDMSKRKPGNSKEKGKNSLTFITDGDMHDEKAGEETVKISDTCYHWSDYKEKVVGEKYKLINDYLAVHKGEHGNGLMYNMLELVRNQEEKINLARFVYLLARLEPTDNDADDVKKQYKEFSKKMYEWIKDEDDRRQLKNAIYLYVYLHREREKKR